MYLWFAVLVFAIVIFTATFTIIIIIVYVFVLSAIVVTIVMSFWSAFDVIYVAFNDFYWAPFTHSNYGSISDATLYCYDKIHTPPHCNSIALVLQYIFTLFLFQFVFLVYFSVYYIDIYFIHQLLYTDNVWQHYQSLARNHSLH